MGPISGLRAFISFYAAKAAPKLIVK